MIRMISYILILLSLYTGCVKANTEFYIQDFWATLYRGHPYGPGDDPDQLCSSFNDAYSAYATSIGGTVNWEFGGIVYNAYNAFGDFFPVGCEFKLCSTIHGVKYCDSYINPVLERTVQDKNVYQISIASLDEEIEPTGMRNSENHSTTLNVQVKDQHGSSYNDIEVDLKINMASNSGGHFHHGDDEDIPNRFGEIAGSNVTKVNNGEFTFSNENELNYTSPIISGVYIISASCVDIDCGTDSTNILVKVPGLEDLGTNPDWVLIGSRPEHPNNHFITDDAKTILMYLASSYRGVFPNEEPLYLNDISLRYGGLFDVYGNWKSPHIEHRKGTVVDIRANLEEGAIKVKNFKKFIQLAKILHVDPYLERHYENGVENVSRRHFHARLLGVRE